MRKYRRVAAIISLCLLFTLLAIQPAEACNSGGIGSRFSGGIVSKLMHPLQWQIWPWNWGGPTPGPSPGPSPGPGPTPPPPTPPGPPIPPPIPVAGLRVMIVHDFTKDTPQFINLIASTNLHVYLAGKCVEYRILDVSSNMANDNAIFQAAFNSVKPPLPALWMGNPTTSTSVPLPGTVADIEKAIDVFAMPAPAPLPKQISFIPNGVAEHCNCHQCPDGGCRNGACICSYKEQFIQAGVHKHEEVSTAPKYAAAVDEIKKGKTLYLYVDCPCPNANYCRQVEAVAPMAKGSVWKCWKAANGELQMQPLSPGGDGLFRQTKSC